MKKVTLILSLITIIFAILGLTRVLSFDITQPIMFFALATLLLVRSLEYQAGNDRSAFILTLTTSVFVYIVTFYNVFIG